MKSRKRFRGVKLLDLIDNWHLWFLERRIPVYPRAVVHWDILHFFLQILNASREEWNELFSMIWILAGVGVSDFGIRVIFTTNGVFTRDNVRLQNIVCCRGNGITFQAIHFDHVVILDVLLRSKRLQEIHFFRVGQFQRLRLVRSQRRPRVRDALVIHVSQESIRFCTRQLVWIRHRRVHVVPDALVQTRRHFPIRILVALAKVRQTVRRVNVQISNHLYTENGRFFGTRGGGVYITPPICVPIRSVDAVLTRRIVVHDWHTIQIRITGVIYQSVIIRERLVQNLNSRVIHGRVIPTANIRQVVTRAVIRPFDDELFAVRNLQVCQLRIVQLVQLSVREAFPQIQKVNS